MANDQIEAIEQSLVPARAEVDFGATLLRLKANKDFQAVVMHGYFEREAIRLVHLKAEAHMQSPESQASINTQIDAIGSFSAYLNAVLYKAANARREIEDGEQAIEEINHENASKGSN